MHGTQRCFLASGCSPRRQQRRVAEGSPPGEPIGHALVTVRHKRRRRAVTYQKYALRAPRVENPTGHVASSPSWRNLVRRSGEGEEVTGVTRPELSRSISFVGEQAEALARLPGDADDRFGS